MPCIPLWCLSLALVCCRNCLVPSLARVFPLVRLVTVRLVFYLFVLCVLFCVGWVRLVLFRRDSFSAAHNGRTPVALACSILA